MKKRTVVVERPRVFLVPLPEQADVQGLIGAVEQLWVAMKLKAMIPKGGLVAIKQHFGERGGANVVPAPVTRAVGEQVKAAGGKPFATDSNTLYNGRRANAVDHLEQSREHGFSHETLGFPVIIADGLKGEAQVTIPMKEGNLKHVFLAGAGYMADAVVVLTHVTGHLVACMGASIKNVAMGMAGRAGKLQQHHSAEPIFSKSKCTACGRCARHCPTAAITVEKYATLDVKRCIGCGECYAFCPHGAVSFEWSETSEALQKKMAEYCLAFHREKQGRVVYINFITRITKNCDCLGKEALPDLGVVASFDPVAADTAVVDLLTARHGHDVFKEFWPQYDARIQLEHGERIGLGSMQYGLVTVGKG